MIPTSKLDKLGRTVVPSPVRKALGLKAGDELEWIILPGRAVVRRKARASPEEIRRRIEELRKRAPKCFVEECEEEMSPYEEAIHEWALAKLGLKEW